ncbi:MAG: sulfatase [Verrucomicrobiae bacterium]|nr:sulfatase [Verrucomicrobiae bacterium]
MTKKPSFRPILSAAFLVALFISPVAARSEAPRPNILFAIADDASYPHMGAYGTNWIKTPGFDRVAAEGLLFNRAYTPNAKCAPSRACILTGRNSWQLEEAANHICDFPIKFHSFMEALKDHGGYTTGFVQKGWGPGNARTADGKPRELTGKAYNKRKNQPPTSGISNNDYAGNFEDFLADCPEGKPWCFWYGSVEPHRGYEFGSGVDKGGRSIDEIDDVPDFWPDSETVRKDMLDYGFEIEWFDSHLVRMLKAIEARGELENTIVVVTADNGMPFPRVKGQEYEMSNHLPLAIMWPKGITKPGRKIDDYVSFIDFAPTFLEVAGVPWEESGMSYSPGRSLTDIFRSEKSGRVIADRDHVLIGKERHDIGRPHDWGYPIRGIVKEGKLYLHNYKTDRWPAGNPETGYLNTDGGATKTEILEMRRSGENTQYWQWNFGKRPEEEMFDISADRECLTNLADDPKFADQKSELRNELEEALREQEDPRMEGNGDYFDQIEYVNPATKSFYERFMSGEKLKAGWVNESDFEKEPLD